MNARVNVKPHTGQIWFTAIEFRRWVFPSVRGANTLVNGSHFMCMCAYVWNSYACTDKEYMFPQVIEVTEFNSEVKIRAETNYLLWSMFWDCNNSDSGFSPFPLEVCHTCNGSGSSVRFGSKSEVSSRVCTILALITIKNYFSFSFGN